MVALDTLPLLIFHALTQELCPVISLPSWLHCRAVVASILPAIDEFANECCMLMLWFVAFFLKLKKKKKK